MQPRELIKERQASQCCVVVALKRNLRMPVLWGQYTTKSSSGVFPVEGLKNSQSSMAERALKGRPGKD